MEDSLDALFDKYSVKKVYSGDELDSLFDKYSKKNVNQEQSVPGSFGERLRAASEAKMAQVVNYSGLDMMAEPPMAQGPAPTEQLQGTVPSSVPIPGGPVPESPLTPGEPRYGNQPTMGQAQQKYSNAGGLYGDRRAEMIPEYAGDDNLSMRKELAIYFSKLTGSPEQIKDVVSQQLGEDAEWRKDKQGNDILEYQGKSMYLNKPGLSPVDVYRGAYTLLKYIPTGALAALSTKLLGRVALSGAGMAATSIAEDAALMPMGSKQGISASEASLEAASGVIGELGAAGLRSGVRKGIDVIKGAGKAIPVEGAAVDAARVAGELLPMPAHAEYAANAKRRLGIDLAQGQASGLPGQQTALRYYSQLDGAEKEVIDYFGKQNKQSAMAMLKILDQIAPKSALSTGARKVRDKVAIPIKKELTQARIDIGKKVYKEAAKSGAEIDLFPVAKEIDELLKITGHKTKAGKALLGARAALVPDKVAKASKPKVVEKIDWTTGNKTKVVVQPTPDEIADAYVLRTEQEFLQLDSMKGDISDRIKATITKLGNTSHAGKRLMQVNDRLKTAMNEHTDLRLKAAREYRAVWKQIDKYDDSALGRIALFKDSELKDVAGALFDTKETDPAVFLNLKRMIQGRDKRAWNEILRVQIERSADIDSLLASAREGMGKQNMLEADLVKGYNIPAKLKNMIFGKVGSRKRKLIMDAADGEQKFNLMFLERVLESASKGRPGGSETVPFARLQGEDVVGKVIKGAGEVAITSAISPAAGAVHVGVKGGHGLINWFTKGRANRRATALGKAMIDPAYTKEMRMIRTSNWTEPRQTAAMVQLLNKVMRDTYGAEEIAE